MRYTDNLMHIIHLIYIYNVHYTISEEGKRKPSCLPPNAEKLKRCRKIPEMEEEQAQSLVTGRVKRYTEDSNATAEVFRSVFCHDQCLFMLLASQSDALIVTQHRDFQPIPIPHPLIAQKHVCPYIL